MDIYILIARIAAGILAVGSVTGFALMMYCAGKAVESSANTLDDWDEWNKRR